MQIETARFGALDIDEARVLTFPGGLPGFEERRRFLLVPHGRGGGSPFDTTSSAAGIATSRPIELTCTPWFSSGFMVWPSSDSGRPCTPIIIGWLGP